MGIRFHCNHCDRQLNVKAKQAGQFCLCPECENEIQIPIESAPHKKKRRRSPNANAMASVSRLTANSLELKRKPDTEVSLTPAATSLPTPAISPRPNSSLENADLVPQDSAPASDSFSKDLRNGDNASEHYDSEHYDGEGHDSEGHANESHASDAPAVAPSPEPNSLPDDTSSFMLSKPAIKLEDDPLRADPEKIWYVRHKRHGEKGPLKAPALEEMIDNGSLRVGHIVWREDWNEWLPAVEVFRQIADRHQQALTDPTYEIPDDVNPHSKLNRDARKRKLIWFSLAIVAFVVVLVLVYWIFNRYS